MRKKRKYVFIIFLLTLVSCNSNRNTAPETFYYSSEAAFLSNNDGLSDSALVGKLMFFDKNLSEPAGTSCATCHSPMSGFSDPRHTAFSVGSRNEPGMRNAPSISYMGFAPNRKEELVRGVMEEVGGFFWDGRAEFLNEQALFPLINVHEMNNASFAKVSEKLKHASYYHRLEKIFGKEAFQKPDLIVFYAVGCLQAFQQSYQVNPFTSKFDFYLKGKIKLSDQEMRGMRLFSDTTKAKCSICHSIQPTLYASTDNILFTDYSYENIGLPKHPLQLHLPVDSGLAKTEVSSPKEIGRFKTPTLRNVAITAPYMHNGVFNTLEEVLEFYNERDSNKKFVPEYPATMNKTEVGNLRLNSEEIKDIIAFLHTLTDGYTLK
ncbi:MAG: cytochrome c peroxidase [Chitinophagales bacterium]